MMKLKKAVRLEWKFPEEILRKKAAGEDAYFRSLTPPPEEGQMPEEGFVAEEELMENIFDWDVEG